MKTTVGQVMDIVFLLSMVTCTAMASWEHLVVYNVTHATSTSPQEAWRSWTAAKTPTTQHLKDLLPSVKGYAPYVSSRVNTWQVDRPEQMKIMAIQYNTTSKNVTILKTATMEVSSNAYDFDAWMTSALLTKPIQTTIASPYDKLEQGTLFKYTFMVDNNTEQLCGMAFLWDSELKPPALFLTSSSREIGHTSDIRYNLRTHDAMFSFPIINQSSSTPGERINSTNLKINLVNQTVGTTSSMLTFIQYELEPGVTISKVTVNILDNWYEKDFELEFYHRNGSVESFTGNVTKGLTVENVHGDVKFVHFECRTILPKFHIDFRYSYLPYDSADFLVLQGYYRFSETTTPSVSTTTTSPDVRTTPPVSTTTTSPDVRTTPPVSTTTTSPDVRTTPPVSTTTTSPDVRTNPPVSTTTASPDVRINPPVSTTTASPNVRTSVNTESGTANSSDQLTSTGAIGLSTTPSCCICEKSSWGNITLEFLAEAGDTEAVQKALQLVEELRSQLTVNKSILTSYRIKKVSIMDMRTSTNAIGSIGVVIIVGVALVIVLLDIMPK